MLQGYLAHKKQRPPRTLQWDYAYGPMAVLVGENVSYERGTPVTAPGRVPVLVQRAPGSVNRFNTPISD